jgi:hypothetical protein
MSRGLVTSGPHFFTSKRERPPLGRRPSGAWHGGEPEARSGGAAAVEAGDVQPSPRASFIAAGRHQDAESVDAVAGSEFVDDRIRLQE